MSRYAQYLVRCSCGNQTSKKYASTHSGKCKACFTGESIQELDPNVQAKTMCRYSDTPTREQRILEHGYQAYAREEGHYGDN